MPLRINIIARTNGVGLDRDVDLVHETLTAAGHDVTISHCRAIPPWRAWLPRKAEYDANIFLERVFPRWFKSARKNLLIPNQERFPHRHLKHLRHIDHILCKSRHAEEIFSAHGNTTFAGFTSADQQNTTVQKDPRAFLHLAGRSTLKGTETVLELWDKHPEWPTLTLIQCEQNAPAAVPANVHLITDYISNEEITHQLNSHGIHLCTSLSEGWGHYIVEAMSCSAVIITTDAPPMNELITPGRGIPIPSQHSEPRHLGTNYHIDPAKLESNIQDLLLMPDDKKQTLGNNARAWFEQNDTHFRQTLPQVIEKIVQL